MDDSNLSREIDLRQYETTRSELEKSIFVQYDVIKIGTLFLSSLLVAIPALFLASDSTQLPYLAAILVGLGFVSMSFVFIMGAGEIRIMRAAAFNNRMVRSLRGPKEANQNESPVWDEFVELWNASFNGMRLSWKYDERLCLSMPFLVITGLADIGATAVLLCWSSGAVPVNLKYIAFVSLAGLLLLQACLYSWPLTLSKRVSNAYKECSRVN